MEGDTAVQPEPERRQDQVAESKNDSIRRRSGWREAPHSKNRNMIDWAAIPPLCEGLQEEKCYAMWMCFGNKEKKRKNINNLM